MSTDTVSGVWTYSIELCSALQADHEIILATMGAPLSREQREEVRRLRVDVRESTWRLEWMDDPWADVAAAGEWLLAIAEHESPDIVHLNSYAHAALPWSAAVVVACHSCVLTWWKAVHGTAPPLHWERYRRIVTAGLQSADVVVSPTVALLDELKRLYGPFRRERVIPNGRRPDDFRPRPKEPHVLSAGRLWDAARNVSTLVAAAPSVRWPVYVAGETAAPDGRTVELPPNVRALGPLSPATLADRMSRAAIYALPARYEPFGLSAVEAALSGCALVLGDIPSLHEVWGPAALYVPPEDPDVLAFALNRLVAAERARKRLSRAAMERARELTPTHTAALYRALYAELGAAVVAPPAHPLSALRAAV